VFVAELSSYQLMDLHKSPHIAVIQNVVPEHLDFHGSFEAYVNAKQAIVQYQNEDDYVIFNASYPIPTRIASVSKAKKIPFGFNPIGQVGCFIDDHFLTFYSNGCCERIIPTQAIPLKGTFNLQNVMPCIIIGKIFGISNEMIANTIQNFQPLEHRLECVGTYSGVTFYNDSLSTIPEAAISAIQAFPNGSFILLAGGYDRGLDFTELARTILASKVKAVILFPTTGEKLWKELVQQVIQGRELPRHIVVTSMADAVQQAYSLAEKEDIVLLSPAAPSFGSFKDYRDRGNQFKAEVRKLIDQHA
jgi:UDP-N-acetylmuramoylalanine--D-glutamate ligase